MNFAAFYSLNSFTVAGFHTAVRNIKATFKFRTCKLLTAVFLTQPELAKLPKKRAYGFVDFNPFSFTLNSVSPAFFKQSSDRLVSSCNVSFGTTSSKFDDLSSASFTVKPRPITLLAKAHSGVKF